MSEAESTSFFASYVEHEREVWTKLSELHAKYKEDPSTLDQVLEEAREVCPSEVWFNIFTKLLFKES